MLFRSVAGQDLTYTVTVHNYGPSDSTGLSVADTLPAGLTFKSAGSSAACSAVGQAVTCTRTTDLAAGADLIYTVVATAAASLTDGSSLANSVTVTGTDPEPATASASNSASASTAVIRRADLGITIADSPDPVVAGTDLTYTVTVTNYGPSSSTGYAASATLPAGVSLVSITGADSADCSGTTAIACSRGTDLTVGSSVAYTLTVTAAASLTDGTTLTAPASVTGTDPEPATASHANSDTATTTEIGRAHV